MSFLTFIMPDPLAETILDRSAKAISSYVGDYRAATYSFTRMYGRGDELVRNIDRESCESLPVCILLDQKVVR